MIQIGLIVAFVPLGLLALAVIIGAFFLRKVVGGRFIQKAWAMQNQVYTGTPTSRRQLVLPNVTQFQTAGALGVIGQQEGSAYGLPFVTLDAYQANVTGATALFNGGFTLPVTGRLANSPLVTHQINPGDKLYLNGATFDATTNVWYGGVIDANPAGIPIGTLDPSSGSVAAGVTASVTVNISTAGGM